MAGVVIPNEPVRGVIPPPWFSGLSGLEQMRAWSGGLLGAPPPTRLTGSRCTHVGPGFATCIMPAAEMLTAPGGHLEIWPLVADALGCAQQTAVGAGQIAQPLTMATNHFRPARAGGGNLTARARVLNASNLLVYAEAQVEDNEGRQIASCGGHARIIALEPKPPPPPEQIEPIEEPRWATPDPWERAPAEALPPDYWDPANHAEIASAVAAGRMPGPLASLLGIAIEDLKSDRLVARMPASEWFCAIGAQRTVAPGFLAAILNTTGWLFGRMELPEALIGLDTAIRFFRPVVADGRPIRAEARNGRGGDNYTVVEVTLFDADGKAIATSNGSAVRLDGARRGRARRRTSERQLCTLLFTDIVSSTERAKTMGDAAWKALREQHDEIARQQIAFCSGLLVKSTGDGLLARFGSPARGIECARRLRDALARLGLQIRSGLHAGECEITEDDVVGAAVNLAARIQTAAEPEEILVSSTMRDLTAGANLKFEDRGEHLLKGFDEPWRLWALKA